MLLGLARQFDVDPGRVTDMYLRVDAHEAELTVVIDEGGGDSTEIKRCARIVDARGAFDA